MRKSDSSRMGVSMFVGLTHMRTYTVGHSQPESHAGAGDGQEDNGQSGGEGVQGIRDLDRLAVCHRRHEAA